MSEPRPAGRPAVEGLRFRGYSGSDDLPALAEVATAASRADGATLVWTPEVLRLEIEAATNADPRDDVLIAAVHDRVVAFARLDWADASDGERHYWSVAHVHPAWRRQGIATALLGRSEARRRAVAEAHHHPGPKRLVTWLEEGDRGGHVLLERSGYERVRLYGHLVRPDLNDILLPPLPAGLERRPITPELLPRVFDAMTEAFRDHFGVQDGSPAAFARWSEEPDFDPDLLVVAFDGDEVAGAVQGSIVPAENAAYGYRRAWVDPVFTRARWRRRGLASALLGRALVRVRERGMTSAQLDVDTENPNAALTLYERHGFRVERSETEWHKAL